MVEFLNMSLLKFLLCCFVCLYWGQWWLKPVLLQIIPDRRNCIPKNFWAFFFLVIFLFVGWWWYNPISRCSGAETLFYRENPLAETVISMKLYGFWLRLFITILHFGFWFYLFEYVFLFNCESNMSILEIYDR